MEFIIAQFVLNPDSDKQAAGHPNGKPGYIDKRKAFMPFDVPKSDLKVVSKHDKAPHKAQSKSNLTKL
jgi:hypothetical protein